MQNTFDGRIWAFSMTLAAGERNSIQPPQAGPGTLAVHALGAGVSALVEFSISPAAAVADGSARWVLARGFGDAGVVANTAFIDEVPSSVTAVRATATGGAVVVEFVQ